MQITTDIDMESLADQLTQYATREEIKSLIVNLDLAAADWDFTAEIFNHFKNEMEKSKKEERS